MSKKLAACCFHFWSVEKAGGGKGLPIVSAVLVAAPLIVWK